MRPHPKKQYGQHFLRDTGILTRLERLIRPESTDCIVEIGAGDGGLSRRIAPLVGRYLAVEVDADLMPPLREALAPCRDVLVMQADVLDLNLGVLIAEAKLDPVRTRLLGNLPYNIASAVIHRSLRLHPPVQDMIFMVQLEVAQRITSPPGSRAYGYLSVDCQHRADARMLFKVPPACFAPRPRVMSAVVHLKPREIPSDTEVDAAFDSLVKAAFAHRRKTLLNSFCLNPVFGPVIGHVLERAGIDERRRAEDLTVAEYEGLALAYQSVVCNRNESPLADGVASESFRRESMRPTNRRNP